MATGISTEKFKVSVEGDITFESFKGEFTVKKKLGHMDQMRQDALKREFLGPVNPQFASVRALNQAEIFSQLHVRIVEAPKWWESANNGLNIEDDNVIKEVYDLAMGVEKRHVEEVKKNALEARGDLKKLGDEDKA